MEEEKLRRKGFRNREDMTMAGKGKQKRWGRRDKQNAEESNDMKGRNEIMLIQLL